MKTNQKLEIFRKIYCFGMKDIQKIFKDESLQQQAYWENKYESCRESFGDYGNFHFLFQLDDENAKKFLDHAGFVDVPNSKDFIMED